eukprot:CAMPEP_0113958876 /NCGR_PEP_ID=MMETSP0011_2-20120614/3750_1 /TAXON_ID=101924 /ORGANISM="Rhodosorus marinus" /LENGTH=200 /DNA_ID=CAMNT_0000969961 /DNA_START=45 /DNA_END=647 /DNA_ORIENTATION=- /assembly_acc=CAM_ASM_000156
MDQQSFGGGFLVSTLTTTVVLVNSILSFLLSELYFWRIPRPEGRGCPVVQDVIRLYELGVDSPVHLYKDSVVYEDPFLRFQGKDELQTAFNILGLLFSSIRITRYAPFWKTNQLLRIYNVQEYTLKVGLTLVIPPKIDLVFDENGKIIAHRDHTFYLPIIGEAAWGIVATPIQALRRLGAQCLCSFLEVRPKHRAPGHLS